MNTNIANVKHFMTVTLYAVYYRNIAFFLLWVLALSSVIGMVVSHFLQYQSLLKWAMAWSISTLVIEILVCFPLLIVSTYRKYVHIALFFTLFFFFDLPTNRIIAIYF